MKKIAQVFSLIFFAFTAIAVAQENQSTKWFRVQSNNGEFSIEVPTEHNFFYDKDGFLVADYANRLQVKEMNTLNAYPEKTLVCFESYQADKKVLDIIRSENKRKSSELKREGYVIKQVVIRTDKSYMVRQYFNSKTHIYVLTVASRTGETKTMKRFLDSLVFNPNSTQLNPTAIQFSKLKVTIPEIDPNPPPIIFPQKPSKSQPKPPEDKTILPIIVLVKHKPSFTESARFVGEDGLIRLRLTFSADGSIIKVELNKALGEGLLREAVFAALRLKFLPSEKDEKPQTVRKIVEYNFTIR